MDSISSLIDTVNSLFTSARLLWEQDGFRLSSGHFVYHPASELPVRRRPLGWRRALWLQSDGADMWTSA